MYLWLKLVGSSLILLAGTAWGLEAAARLERRVHLLQGLKLGLSLLETEISYGRLPLPRAMMKVASHLKETGTAPLFRKCGVCMEPGKGLVAEEAWRESVADFLRREPALKDQDGEILLALGGYLGLSDPQDQLKHLRLAQERLRFQEKQAYEEAVRQGKIYRYAGFATAAVLVLVLV